MRCAPTRFLPALSLQPVGERMLIARTEPTLPTPSPMVQAAANTLTFEAVSYQAKGHWLDGENPGRLLVQEVYAGGPPIPGGRVA